MAYQQNIPTGQVKLNIDYINVLQNFQALDTTFGTDHLPFSNTTPNLGFHTQVHFDHNIASPTLGGAVGMIYPNTDVSTQSFPFWKNGTKVTQIIGNSSIGTNGYVTLAAGLILQWGIVSAPSDGTTVTFPFTFPTNVFSINATIRNGSSMAIAVNNISTASFKISFATTPNFVYWMAVGN